MAKKVLIISTSLRGGSNSDILAKECAKGAKEAGHDVELLSLKGKDIKYCIGLNVYTHLKLEDAEKEIKRLENVEKELKKCTQ